MTNRRGWMGIALEAVAIDSLLTSFFNKWFDHGHIPWKIITSVIILLKKHQEALIVTGL